MQPHLRLCACGCWSTFTPDRPSQRQALHRLIIQAMGLGQQTRPLAQGGALLQLRFGLRKRTRVKTGGVPLNGRSAFHAGSVA